MTSHIGTDIWKSALTEFFERCWGVVIPAFYSRREKPVSAPLASHGALSLRKYYNHISFEAGIARINLTGD